MASKKELERALELAVMVITDCPVTPQGVDRLKFCEICLREPGLKGCYKLMKAHFIKQARAKGKV